MRTALSGLAQASQQLATPLEGLDPRLLLRSVQTMLAAGLLDDLHWLHAPEAAVAVAQLCESLPTSAVRSRLHNKLLTLLQDADAPTFAAVATTLARGTRNGLHTPELRARVALSMTFPIGADAHCEELALALLSRPDLACSWLEDPSRGGMAARMQAAQVLELAAHGAIQRQARGDRSGLQKLQTPQVQGVLERLLNDQASQVWTWAASARGLLSVSMPHLLEDLQRNLDETDLPQAWRRGAASLASRLAVDPEDAQPDCAQLLESPLLRKDPCVAAAMIMGLRRACQARPDTAEPLLEPLLRLGGLHAMEALVELLGEGFDANLGREARTLAVRALNVQLNKPAGDDSQQGLLEALKWRLSGHARECADGLLNTSLHTLCQHGVAQAAPLATRTAEAVQEAVSEVRSANVATPEGRCAAVHGLMELHWSVLRSSTLDNLLSLTPSAPIRVALEESYDKLARWLGSPQLQTPPDGQLHHPTLQLRRADALRGMLEREGYEARAEENRTRRLRAVRGLLQEAAAEQPAALRRALIMGAARGSEALIRDTTFELSDVMVAAMSYLHKHEDMVALAHASMSTELEACLTAVAELSRHTDEALDTASSRRHCVAALDALAQTLQHAHSPRTYTLRQILLRTQRALRHVQDAGHLSELVSGEYGKTLDDLVDAVQELAQMVVGARLRIDARTALPVPMLGHAMQSLKEAVQQAARDRDPRLVQAPLEQLNQRAEQELPLPLQAALRSGLSALQKLPPVGRRGSRLDLIAVPATPAPAAGNLPEWLPPNSTLGSFHVLHAIGEGGGGSVFVAKRNEDRDSPDAELVALKVPDYAGGAARSLSEQDFLQMFREEAGALLSMPQDQPHLARFVTFDAGARPKPILVMEYVEGPSLERLLSRRHLDTAGAFAVLNGIARGLRSMHALNVAHLDVKPSNVILRDFWSGAALEPVLVDFGMSGRRLRPGCCTVQYGAPEIWGTTEGVDPRAADMYAFGCMIYEVLTARRLFSAETEVGLISAHMMHDGVPEDLQPYYDELSLRPLAECIRSCLRQAPDARVTIEEVGLQLDLLAPTLAEHRWPLRPRAHKRAQA